MKKDKLYMPENYMEGLYNSNNLIVRFVHNGRLRAIVNELPNKKNLKILDAGCGEGQLIREIHNHTFRFNDKYYGVDATSVAVKYAKKRCPYAEIKLMDITRINYPDNYFDVVTCTEVLEHITNYELTLREFERVLKKGGVLIMTFPNEFLWTSGRFVTFRWPAKTPDHVNSFSPRFIAKKTKLKYVKNVNLPFHMPFCMSLTGLVKFVK